ncbi:MAG: TldD/PmbA family protein [Candidatus Zixiibacteriota bacterium]|nr:MAG: TldD/PmbA family protein [candidate division Zixibacteria bacterium]
MAQIEKLAIDAVERARSLGASYADGRYIEIEDESLSFSDGSPESVNRSVDRGMGIRVLVEGAWGFFGTSVINEKEISRAVKYAVDIGRASATLNDKPVKLADTESFKDDYISNFEIDPFEIALKEKLEYLSELDGMMAAREELNTRNSHIDFRKTVAFFASSEGTRVNQKIIHSGVGLELGISRSHRERATRSFPKNGGQYECKGYELLSEYDFKSEIPRLAEEVQALLAAEACPSKTIDAVFEGSVVSLLIHELIGHPLELDRVFGSERNFSGTSFATVDRLGKLRYGSPIINVFSDPTHPHGLASYGYDDEGVKAHKADLIRNGILVGYLSSRETAAMISARSTGAMRADSWGNMPIIRITNVSLAPGDMTFDDIISSVDDGIYMSTISSWSPSDDRSSFEFGCEIAREIKGGKLGRVFKNPTFSGKTIDFWSSVKGVADESSWKVWGTPNCGKGQPGQNARTAQGASPILVSDVKVGA